jgi:rhomboid protease GluP
MRLPSTTFAEIFEYCPDCLTQQFSGFQPVSPAAWRGDLWRSGVATKLLIAANVSVFFALVASGASPFFPNVNRLVQWGANYGPYTLADQYWRLVTSSFLHFDIFHLGLNMLCLFWVGSVIEKILGRYVVIAIYLLSGIGAGLLSLSWSHLRVSPGPQEPSLDLQEP